MKTLLSWSTEPSFSISANRSIRSVFVPLREGSLGAILRTNGLPLLPLNPEAPPVVRPLPIAGWGTVKAETSPAETRQRERKAVQDRIVGC